MVHYRDSAESGGSLRVGETIANHIDPQRVSVEMVFAYGSRGSIAERSSVPCHFIGANSPKDFPAWVRARALFRQIQPDLIHFQDGIVWLRTALLGTPYRKIVHVHGRYQRASPAGGRNDQPFRASQLLRLYLRSTDAQVCINNGARESLLSLGWISPEKSYVVYNGIDPSRFGRRSNPLVARSQLGLPKNALLLGMVCRLVREKGCADLLSIIERLPARWHGVICGDGPERKPLEQACKERGLGHRIHFIGLQNDVAPVYAALDAYAFLSRYEPFGLVLAEAMASGVPIFGIESDGEYNEREYPLLPSNTADLFRFQSSRSTREALPDETLDEVARRISNYGEHPERYERMIERARAWVSACFAATVQAQAMARVYADVCRPSVSALQLAKWYESKRTNAEASIELISPQEFETALT